MGQMSWGTFRALPTGGALVLKVTLDPKFRFGLCILRKPRRTLEAANKMGSTWGSAGALQRTCHFPRESDQLRGGAWHALLSLSEWWRAGLGRAGAETPDPLKELGRHKSLGC